MKRKSDLSTLRDFLHFNKSERRGLFVLSTIICILILGNIFMPYLIPAQKHDFSSFQKEMDEFLKQQELIEDVPKKQQYSNNFDYNNPDRSAAELKLTPFPFDPNNMTTQEWSKLGLADWKVRMIEKYKAKGGKFRNKDDFKKMYCITEAEYIILEPYLQIANESISPEPINKETWQEKKPDIPMIEINSATSEDFEKMPGVGDWFAQKIVAYRSSLGGFVRIDQLKEVNKMDSARYNSMLPYLKINTNAIRRINVNTAGFDDLKKHPYIGYNIALSLINYRDSHGQYKVMTDIKKSALVTEAVYLKISPYLKVE